MSFIRIRRRRDDTRSNRLKERSDRASKRRTERAEIVKHRKWIFMSLAVIAVVVLVFFIIMKVT